MSPPTLGVPNASVDKLLNTPYTRTLPIKRYDAEPLSRSDLQHNLLSHIFNDQTRCFTNPRPIQLASKVPNYQPSLLYPYGHSLHCSRRSDETQQEFDKWRSDYQDWNQKTQNDTKESNVNGDPTPGCKYLTFKELYIEAIVGSARCTKTMRDKLIADPEYAEDFAKVCLLVNVGKMNTTLAFYPEMKTILRSYHPLPSVQRNENTRKVMQDAPRMKTILKSAFLIHEEPPAVSSRITKNEVVDPSTKTPTAKNDKSAKNRKAAVKNAEENNITLEDVPSNLDDIFEKFNRRNQTSSRDPVTSICTLLFILSTVPEEITALHFDNEKKKNGKKKSGGGGGEGNGKGKEVENEEEQDEFLVDEDEGLTKDQIEKEGEDFLSIFFPRKDSYLSSKSRAKSFLWLIWNYYEGFNRLPFLSRDLIQSNPFNDEHSLRSENYILNYFNQLNPVQKEDLIQKSNGRWKGIENPEGLIWLKASLPSPSSSSGNKSAATIAKEQQAAKLKTVSSLMTLIEKDGAPSILYDTAPKPKGGFPPPSLFKKRLLAPRFEKISKEKWESENLDTEEELKWGKEMKEERGRFLIEFAGNEQKKALSLAEANSGGGIDGEDIREKRENSIQSTRSGLLPGGDGDEEDELMSERGTPAPPLGHAVKNSGSGSGKGKRKATDSINGESAGGGRVSKRIPQGNSSYPLANILAQANKTAQGIVGDSPSNSSPGPSSSKMEISQSKDGEGEEEITTNTQEQIQLDQDGLMIPGKQYLINHENQISTLKNLWNSDLSYPKTLEILENQNFISSNPSTSTTSSEFEKKRLLHFDSDPRFNNGSGERLIPPLPLQAWNRILNRAAKGVGDASYESDDEEVLMNDAVDELPRGELSRILRVLRCVRGVELGSEDASGGIKMEVD